MTINYIGSKKQLLPWIHETIANHHKLENAIFCDLFAGTHTVGKYFNQYCKQIIANDLEYYSYVIGKAELASSNFDQKKLLDILNNLEGQPGIICNALCEEGSKERLYFSKENGQKIDAIQIYLQHKLKSSELKLEQYIVALCSLLYAADKVANTTSVYGAYLKNLKKSAKHSLLMKPIDIGTSKNNIVYNDLAESIVEKLTGDILYLDPPYNNRQYGSNYHVLNTIALYDTENLSGKTGLRSYKSSKFCSKKLASSTLEHIITKADFNLIVLSYSSESLLKKDHIKLMFEKYGKVNIYEKSHKTYKADSSRNNKSSTVSEYLFLLEK